MITSLFRRAALRRGTALSFMLMACLACTRQGVGAVNPSEVFTDPRTAALAAAVADGDAARVRALAQGADLGTRGDKGVTLLQWALLNKSVAGLQALLDAGADPAQPGIDGDTVVHLAAMANDGKYLTALLAHGADPNAPNGVTRATPIVSALMGEREAQFRALLAAGADPNAADRTGNTPLHEAAKINEPQRVLELLQAGANPQAANVRGATFQRFLFRTRDAVVNDEVRRGREAVRDWLRAHSIPIEDAAAQ